MLVNSATVLIIDDDPILVEFLKEILSLKGYKVISAPDGRTGLVVVQQYRPCLILLDIGLPILDGWAFLTVYASQTEIQAPIIIMSNPSNACASIPYVASFLPKPFRVETLFDLIEHNIFAVGA